MQLVERGLSKALFRSFLRGSEPLVQPWSWAPHFSWCFVQIWTRLPMSLVILGMGWVLPSCNSQRWSLGRGGGNILPKTCCPAPHTLLCSARQTNSKHSQVLNTVSSLKSSTCLQLFLQLYKDFFIAPAFQQVYHQQLLKNTAALVTCRNYSIYLFC